MQSRTMKLSAFVAALAILAACGNGGGAGKGIQSLGSVFQKAFAQGPNDTPLDITNANLKLRLKKEPFEL